MSTIDVSEYSRSRRRKKKPIFAFNLEKSNNFELPFLATKPLTKSLPKKLDTLRTPETQKPKPNSLKVATATPPQTVKESVSPTPLTKTVSFQTVNI